LSNSLAQETNKQYSVSSSQTFTPIGKNKFDLPLVGNGHSRSDCGVTLRFKCDDLQAHANTLLQEHSNHVVVRVIHKSCKRADCPICFKTWAHEETERAVHRYRNHSNLPNFQRRKIIHVILSPSTMSLNKCENISQLRKEAQKQAKKAGLLGGSLIFHSKHKKCDLCGGEITKKGRCKICGASQWSWQYYPHFHFVGYGWVINDSYKNKLQSWLIVNLGVRDKIGGLIHYELMHSAHLGKKHIVSWFGCMSYNSFKCPKLEKKVKKCPVCGGEMKKFVSIGTFPTREGVYYFTQEEFDENSKPPEEWHYKEIVKKSQTLVPTPEELEAWRIFNENPTLPKRMY